MEKRKLNIEIQTETQTEVEVETKLKPAIQAPITIDAYSTEFIRFECTTCSNSMNFQRMHVSGSADFVCGNCGGFFREVKEDGSDDNVLKGSIFD